MKNLILPAEYSHSKLEQAKRELIAKAKARESQEIQLCGDSKDWDDCFMGFLRNDGSFTMIFTYNIGMNTFATSGEFYIF